MRMPSEAPRAGPSLPMVSCAALLGIFGASYPNSKCRPKRDSPKGCPKNSALDDDEPCGFAALVSRMSLVDGASAQMVICRDELRTHMRSTTRHERTVSCGENPVRRARKRAENPVETIRFPPEQEVSMSQVDPWEKAADCERALRITVDPVHRETLSNIREFWITLAHESRFLSDEALATQIETIGRLHAKFDRDAHA